MDRPPVEHLLEHPKATITLAPLPDNKNIHVVTVIPKDAQKTIKRSSCQTSYSIELLQHILDIKGPFQLCDEIARDEDPRYVQADLKHGISSYVDSEWFKKKRILDFGCGSGASTVILSRFYPTAEIVGIDLNDQLLSIAGRRMDFYKQDKVCFLQSPSGETLPDNLGKFDAVIMSAVYEHLLPQERMTVMPQLWNVLNPGGILFLNQTPFRYFPIEGHSSRLPFINYMPDWLSLLYATRCSKYIDRQTDWNRLLRGGIRGGSRKEILRILENTKDGQAELLTPSQHGLKDEIDLWFSLSSTVRYRFLKRGLRLMLKSIKILTGAVITPSLTIAIQKKT